MLAHRRILAAAILLGISAPLLADIEVASTQRSGPDPRPRIAIAGFQPEPGGDPRDAWIPVALQELLAYRLRRLPTLLAIPTERAYQAYRELHEPGAEPPPWPNVARALGATHLLRGDCSGRARDLTLVLTLERLDALADDPVTATFGPGRLYDILDQATRWSLERFNADQLDAALHELVYAPLTTSVSAAEYYARGLTAAREDDLREALRLAQDALGSDRHFQLAQRLLALLELRAGSFQTAVPRLRALAANAQARNDPRSRADALLRQCLLSQIAGGYDAAIARAKSALAISLEQNDPFGEIAAVDLMGDLHLTRQPPPDPGLSDEDRRQFRRENVTNAIESQRLLVDLLNTVGDRVSSLAATNKLGLLHEQAGSLDEALSAHKRTLSLSQELRSRRHEATGWMFLGQCYRRREEWAEAIDATKRCLALAEASAKPGVQIVLGRLYLDMKDPQEALGQFEEAYKQLESSDDVLDQFTCLREAARARMELGRRSEAIKTLQQAIDLAHVLELSEEKELRAQLKDWQSSSP